MMPHLNKALMLLEPESSPTSVADARRQGFTDVTFYPSIREARQAAGERQKTTGRKAVAFNEIVEIGGMTYVLHVVAQTPRPKPKMKCPVVSGILREPCPVCSWFVCKCPDTSDIPEVKDWSRAVIGKFYRPRPKPEPKLDAFAVFIAEWAARLRKVVSR